MNVRELIELLQAQNPEAEVIAKIAADGCEVPVDGIIETDNYNEVYIDVGVW